MARDVGQWQRAAGDPQAKVEVVAALGALNGQGRDVNRDLDGRVVFAHPLDSGFQVGIAGYDDDGIRAGVQGVVDEVDGDVDVGFFSSGDKYCNWRGQAAARQVTGPS